MGIILTALGWEPVDQDVREMAKNGKYVLVYPHTSTFDFIFYILYHISLQDINHKMKTPVNPRQMEQWAWLIERFGCIMVSARDERGGGSVKKVVDELNKLDSFILLISPKGSVRKDDEWRSGFYHIAKETGAKIVAGGFDYEKKKFVFKEPFDPKDMTFEQTCILTKRLLYDITPLNVENTEYPTLGHSYPVYPSVISNDRLIIFLFTVGIVVLFIVGIIIIVKQWKKRQI